MVDRGDISALDNVISDLEAARSVEDVKVVLSQALKLMRRIATRHDEGVYDEFQRFGRSPLARSFSISVTARGH